MYRKTILVIDHQPHIRAFIRAVLEREGCRILEAPDDRAASAALRQPGSPVSLALIDVESRADVPPAALEQVPVLFMSGHEREALIANGQLHSSADLLAKPLTVRGLIAAVESRLAAEPTDPHRRRQ